MTIDRFWDLFSKKQCGEASSSELKELEEILLTHPEWKQTAEALSTLNFQSTAFGNNEEAERAFETHVNRMKKADVEFGDIKLNYDEVEPERRRRNSKKWLISAGILVGALILVFIFKISVVSSETKIGKQTNLNQVNTEPGSRKTRVHLPDGSVVWLNSSSKLTYDKNFGKNIREVSLTGEAFFDVTKDSSHPFIIHTSVMDIKVLGTAFNVRSYPGDASTETSLIRGKVEITVKNRSNAKIYLNPNEKLTVLNNVTVNKITASQGPVKNASEKTLSVDQLNYSPVDSTPIETAWVDSKLRFQKNETFKEVALKMERWYAVTIIFDDKEVEQIPLFGSFTTETIDQALDALREIHAFKYTKSENVIRITK